jgi:MFS family permease
VLRAPFGPLAWTIGLLLVGGIGLQVYTPLYVAAGRGLPPRQAAFSVMFFVVGWTIGAQLSSRIGDRLGTIPVLSIGGGVVAPATFATAALMAVNAPLWSVFTTTVLVGGGLGMSTNSALTALRELADDTELGRAVAAHQYIRSQGFAGGPALAGGVLLLVVASRTGDVEAVRELLAAGGEGGGELSAAGEQVAAAVRVGFAWSVGACAVVATAAQVPLRAVRRHAAARRAGQAAHPAARRRDEPEVVEGTS